jgi:type II secretory pathway pseudopilin PulG
MSRLVQSRGFTVIELMISVGVLLAVLGPVMALFAQLEHSYAGTQQGIAVQMQAQSAISLMSDEIELAGSNATTDTVLSTSVGPCSQGCEVNVASGAGLNVGDQVQLDSGNNQELITVQNVGVTSGQSWFEAVLKKGHTNGATVVYPGYPYASGIYKVTGSYAGTCPSGAECGDELQMFGNLQGDGIINFAEYKFDSAAQTLNRSLTPVTAASLNAAYPICDHVTSVEFIAYPIGNSSIYGYLNVSLTVESPYLNPQTGTYDLFNLHRGVLEARDEAVAAAMMNSWEASNLAPTPANVATLSAQ